MTSSNGKTRTKTGDLSLMPWQGVLMVACVTAAGLLHERAETRRPLDLAAQAAPLRSGLHAGHASDVVETVLLLTR